MDVRAFIKEITSGSDYADQIIHVREVEPRQARYSEPIAEIPQVLWSLLRRQNIHRLYTHQSSAIDALGAGKDIVVVTSTASGKTLCYNLPVVRRVLEDPKARAMYIYPTKALAQDQYGVLQRWACEEELIERLRPAVYDGDTPGHSRTKIRSKANVVLTNPDMLHVGILPYHAKWHEFLANLEYLVIDEMHTYRGIFGSHVAGVLRRLLRMCDHYGRRRPKVICCSATIANPLELATRLTATKPELIDDDGSPRGRKYFMLWNPPYLDADNVNRRSANVEAVNLMVELVRRRVQTIVFAKARIVVELVHKYASEALGGNDDLASRIRPYRGGYLPQERRSIEQELFSGRLLAVSTTNALELGIDVGSMDAAVLVGFPGTICSTWQQAGRAGRSIQDSLVVMVGYDDPIDQYLMRHPEYLFGASHEQAIIDPDNPHILSAQLSCASFEKPISPDDRRYFGPLAGQIINVLADEGKLKTIDERSYWAQSQQPCREVSLRNISTDTYAIVNTKNGQESLGNVDAISAPELVYPGAVYLHEGNGFLVRRLDEEAKIAYVEPAQVDYYTQPILASSCRLGEPEERKEFRDGKLCFGPADVTWQTTAFRKIRYYTMELIGQGKLDLPAQTLSTTGVWYSPGESIRQKVAMAGFNPIEALLGVRNLLLASLPALAMSDRKDISGMVDSSNLGVPTIFVYDRYNGGLGFAQMGFDRFEEWLGMCGAIVRECRCREGCPSCVGLANLRPPLHQDPDLGGGYPVPNKAATILLLNLLD